jgi:hypothetical protein
MTWGWYVWMLTMTSDHLKSVLCMVCIKCSATANHWFFSLASPTCSDILMEMWRSDYDPQFVSVTHFSVDPQYNILPKSIVQFLGWNVAGWLDSEVFPRCFHFMHYMQRTFKSCWYFCILLQIQYNILYLNKMCMPKAFFVILHTSMAAKPHTHHLLYYFFH